MDDLINDVLLGSADLEELGDCEVLHSNELLRQHLTDPAVRELGKTLRSTRKHVVSKPPGVKKEKVQEECYVCGKFLVDSDGLKRHMLLHKNIKKYGCKACDKQFHTAGNRSKHYKRVHLKFKPFHCPFCKRDFFSKSHLDTHIASHTGEKKFKCNVCNAAFARNWVLTNHMYIHTGETPYKCDVCPYACRDNSTLRKHKRRHGSDPYYTCKVCGKKYAEKQRLKCHIAEHLGADTKIFHCEHCTRRFKVKQALVNHMKIKHFKVKRWRCKICTGTYWSEERLRSHHERKHAGGGEEVFICGEGDCGIVFNSKPNLVRHGRRHGFGGHRIPGSCSVCGRQFRSLARAKKHEDNVHRGGESEQNCTRCGRMFFAKRHLIIHTRRHNNGGTFYYCHHCDWGYSSKLLLWRHIKSAHQCNMQGFYCQFPNCKKQFWHEKIVKRHMLSIHKMKYVKPIVGKIPKMEENTQIQVAELHIDAEGVEVKQELMDEFLEVLGIDDLEHFGDDGAKKELFEEETDSKDFAVFTVPRPQIKKELKIKSEKFQINAKKDVSELNDGEMSKIAQKLKSNSRKNRKKAEAIIRYHYTKRFKQVPKVPKEIFDHFINTRASEETECESVEVKSESGMNWRTAAVKEEPIETLFETDSETEISCETLVDETPTENNEHGQKHTGVECVEEESSTQTKCHNDKADTHGVVPETARENTEAGHNENIDSQCETGANELRRGIFDENKVEKFLCETETQCGTQNIATKACENAKLDSENQETSENEETQRQTTKLSIANEKLISEIDEIGCEGEKTNSETPKTQYETGKTNCEIVNNGPEEFRNPKKSDDITGKERKAKETSRESQDESPKNPEKIDKKAELDKMCEETTCENQSGRPRRKKTLVNYTDYRVMAGLTPTRKKYWNWNRANDFFVDEKSEVKEKSNKKSKKNVTSATNEKETDVDVGNPLEKVQVGNVKQNYNKFYKTTVCMEQCYTCMQIFSSKEDLDEHMYSEHLIVKCNSLIKKCPHCNYSSRFNMRRHIQEVHGIKLRDKLKPIQVVKKKPIKKTSNPTKKKLVCKNGVWHVVEQNVTESSEKSVGIKDSDMSICDYLKKMSDLSKIATKTKKETLYPCNKCTKTCIAYCGLKVHMRVHDPDAKPFKPKVWKHKIMKQTQTADKIEFSDAEYFNVYPKFKKEVRELTLFKSDLMRIANTKREIEKNGGRTSEMTSKDISKIFNTKLSNLKHNMLNVQKTIYPSVQNVAEMSNKNVKSDLINAKIIDYKPNTESKTEIIKKNVDHNSIPTTKDTQNNEKIGTILSSENAKVNSRSGFKNENIESKNEDETQKMIISSEKFRKSPKSKPKPEKNIEDIEMKRIGNSSENNNKTQMEGISSENLSSDQISTQNVKRESIRAKNIEIVQPATSNENVCMSTKIEKQNVAINRISEMKKVPQNNPKKVTSISPKITFLKGTKTVKKPNIIKTDSRKKNYTRKDKLGSNANELKCLLCPKVFENKRILEKHLYEHICGNSLTNEPSTPKIN